MIGNIVLQFLSYRIPFFGIELSYLLVSRMTQSHNAVSRSYDKRGD